MTRNFFDTRINNDLGTNHEGVSLPDLQAVQREAMRVLADMAKELIDFLSPCLSKSATRSGR